MIQLIYTSKAAPGLTRNDVDSLLERARQSNQQNGITGVMLFDGRMFSQLLEGDDIVVDGLFERIVRDHRHSAVQPMIREMIPARQFSSWSMAYAVGDPKSGTRRFGGTMNPKGALEFVRVLKGGKSFVRQFFADTLIEFAEG